MAIASPRRIFKICFAALTPCLFLAGVFFDARAQGQLPDLVLHEASLSGNGTAVVYRNDGTSVSGRPYTVSFQWVDTNGAPLAPKQTVLRNTIAGRGYDFLTWGGTTVQGVVIVTEQRCSTSGFFRRTTRCYPVQVQRTVTQTLAAYRLARPKADALLAVMVDDGNQIAEGNETNNAARVGDTPFRAPPPLPPSELAISRATFDGKDFFVAFQNQSSVAITDRPFDVALEWLDSAGAPTGDKRFFRLKNLPPAAVQVIDSRTGIAVSFPVGANPDLLASEPIAGFLARRPANAAKMRVTLDERGQIPEINEANNIALIDLPTPDFFIMSPVFGPQALSFRYVNGGAAVPSQTSLFSFWFEWVDAKGARVGNHLYWLDRPALAIPPNLPLTFTSTGIRVFSSAGAVLLDQVLQNPPPEAVSLKISLDGPNAFRENNESNNTVILPKPVRPLPDLAFGVVEVKGGALRMEVRNDGVIPSAPADMLMQWFNADGSPGLSSLLSAATGTRPIFPKSSSPVVLSLNGQSPAERLIANPPKNAARLQITLDPIRRVTEANEDNNTASVDYTALAKPLPDLSITKDLQMFNGKQLTFTYANLNAGAPLTQSPTVSFWFEWVDASGTRVGDLAWYDRPAASMPSGTTPLVFSSRSIFVYKGKSFASLDSVMQNPPAGAVSLKVTVDGPDKFRETNEGNNIAVFPRPVSAAADLVISSATVKDRALHITARNAGGADAPKTDIAFLWIGGSPDVVFYTLDPVSAGKETTVKIPLDGAGNASVFLAKPPEGAKQLRIFLDGNQKLEESNDENNVAFVDRAEFPALEEERLPDMALTAGVRAGGVVKLTIVNGTTDTLRAPLLQFKWMDAQDKTLETSPVSSWSGTNIASGKIGEFAIEYERWREDGVTRFLKRPPAGAAALLATIDPENKLKESNEGNNSVRIALGQPDLLLGTAEVRDGALRIEVKNGGAVASGATDIWLMWFGAKGALPSSAAVELPAIAPGTSADVSVPFDGKTEASTILREPPKESTRLRVFADGSRRVEESNEENNDALVDRSTLAVKEPAVLSDLAFTLVFVPPGGNFLVIGFQNAGKAEVKEWQWHMKWLDASGRAIGESYRNTHPGLKPAWRYGATSDMQDKTGTPKPLGEFLKQPPEGAAQIEIAIDPENKIEESDEKNNIQRFDVAKFPPSLLARPKPAVEPEMSLLLTAEVISRTQASASSSATAGLALALLALASGGFLIFEHHGSRGGAGRYAGVFPLLFTSHHQSYMRLRGCGPEGCTGAHFEHHRRLKRITRTSLAVALAAGAIKFGLAYSLLVSATPALAKQDASAGDDVRATVTVKNTAAGALEGVTLRLACPTGTLWQSTRVNDREDKRDSSQAIEMSALAPGASQRLSSVCRIKDIATGNLRFSAEARIASAPERRWTSNIVEVNVKPRQEKESLKIGELADLSIEGIGFLPLINVVEAPNEPLPSIFSAYVSNLGTKAAGPTKTRVRLDIGANGSWDVTSKLETTESLIPGAQTLVKIPLTWNAPLGTTVFEICADAGKEVDETNEADNCDKDRLTIQMGEEPAQEEPGVEE